MRFYHAAPKETMMKIYAEGVLKKSSPMHMIIAFVTAGDCLTW